MILMFLNIWQEIGAFFWDILISLVAGIYLLVNYTYQIFLVLAKTNIFEQQQYQALTDKIYVILGVVMMFVIAYNFLMLVVDPDKNKGGATVEKMLKNIVISFILIVVMPSIFSFAFKVQDAILEQGIFSKFFTDVTETGFEGDDSIKNGGKLMSTSTFNAFYKVAEGAASSHGNAALEEIKNQSSGGIYRDEDGKIIADCSSPGKCTLREAQQAAYQTGSFGPYYAFAMNIVKKEVSFDWFISLVAGGYLLYVIISFCFDLAVRVCKLAFYQIIAPLAISCRILPNKESIYSNWQKASIQTYISVFIRIFIMNLGVYLISVFADSNFFETACDDCSFGVTAFAAAFIILGIVTFMKSAAKLVDDIFGIGDGISLGIMGKLADGGAFMGGAALGAGITSLTRNATHAIGNIKNAKKGERFGAVVKGIGSTVAGGVSGTARGLKYGSSAKTAADMKNQTSQAVQKTIEKRDKREAYRAAHDLGPIKGTMPIIGGLAVAAGHLQDAGKDVARWAGVDNIEALEKQNAAIAALVNAVDGVKDTAKDVIMSDAMKNKTNTYGIAPTIIWSESGKFKNAAGHTVTVTANYNSSEYHKMEQIIQEAKTTGASTVNWNGETFTLGEFEDIKGLYLKSFSEQVSNQAAKTNEHWDSTASWYFDPSEIAGLTGDALEAKKQELVEKYKISLDKVRHKAVDLRHELEDSLNSPVIEAANAAASSDTITRESVKGADLKFHKDTALDKLGDKAKVQTQANYAKIKKEKEQEKKK